LNSFILIIDMCPNAKINEFLSDRLTGMSDGFVYTDSERIKNTHQIIHFNMMELS
jgi:hypothetical protein